MDKKRLKKQLREKPITMTAKEIEKLKFESMQNAIEIMQLFPIWILRAKYGFGEKRLKEFMEYYQDLIDSYNKGYVDLPDIAKQLEIETNLKIKKGHTYD